MKLPQNHPYIAVVLENRNIQFFLAAERKVLDTCERFSDAIMSLIAVYFTFDIEYPKSLYPVFIFLQHFVMEIKDDQPIPNVLTRLMSSVDRIL